MTMRNPIAAALLAAWLLPAATPAWRASLYPANWQAPEAQAFYSDKFLQDFSYAGYHRGEDPLPQASGLRLDATRAPFLADSSGRRDATAAIQAALDSAAKAGGGVVHLPAGTYRLSVAPSAKRALGIHGSRVVLQGAGVGKTFLRNDTTAMRGKAVIEAVPSAWSKWNNVPARRARLSRDLATPTRTIPVDDPSLFSVGQWVIVRQAITSAWVVDHKEDGVDGWATSYAQFAGLQYCRKVLSIDAAAKTLEIDAPTRYALWMRDSAMVYPAPAMLEEVGVEHLSIGNIESKKAGWAEEDYNVSGTGAWDAHDSWAIRFSRVRDGWIRRVETFQPAENASTAHILSNGVSLDQTRGITVDSCHFQRPQFGGGGGNGYMYRVMGNESLIRDSRATQSRHGFVLSGMNASGNVFLRAHDKDGGFQTGSTGRERTSGRGNDHHMHFSHSNLFDDCTAENSNFQAAYRPYGSAPLKHNLTAAHSVYWNTQGLGGDAWVVHSQQGRYGYVIGTRGTVTEVRTSATTAASAAATDPVDIVEGKGLGATLEPASLHADQLSRRLASGPVSLAPEAAGAAPAATTSRIRFDGKGIVVDGRRIDGSPAGR